MAGMSDIKRRIRSIKNTQQITKAMQMVAAAKLRKLQEKVISARPYAHKVREVISHFVKTVEDSSHPLMEKHDEGGIAYAFITGDRGLCGGYNSNIIRLIESTVRNVEESVSLIPIGRRGRDYFQRRDVNIAKEFIDIGDEPSYIQAREMTRQLAEMFLDKTYKEIFLVYTEFYSVIKHKPVVIRLLPISSPEEVEGEEEQVKRVDYIYEPSQADVLATLLPRYLETMVYLSLLEAKTSEYGARMTAMDSATSNAEEMIDKLTLSFNRARQDAITTEILEVVGGADALK